MLLDLQIKILRKIHFAHIRGVSLCLFLLRQFDCLPELSVHKLPQKRLPKRGSARSALATAIPAMPIASASVSPATPPLTLEFSTASLANASQLPTTSKAQLRWPVRPLWLSGLQVSHSVHPLQQRQLPAVQPLCVCLPSPVLRGQSRAQVLGLPLRLPDLQQRRCLPLLCFFPHPRFLYWPVRDLSWRL
jgi:hypothetical protein